MQRKKHGLRDVHFYLGAYMIVTSAQLSNHSPYANLKDLRQNPDQADVKGR